MTTRNVSAPDERSFLTIPESSQIDLTGARIAYEGSIGNPRERHAEVGILLPNGKIEYARLGKDEEYGPHRVGSVTKTFTTFLALKLAKDGVLPQGLKTRCGDLLSRDILTKVFEDPVAAANMTLEQLLSHTAGLEIDDHSRDQKTPSSTMHERFLQEGSAAEGRKYRHTSLPGDGIGSYSNAGVAVAGWMLEVAYNKYSGKEPPVIPFSQIMKRELFEGVFGLSDPFIGPAPSGDIIQTPAGGMTASIGDLMRVAARLQQGEASLEHFFGTGWQRTMLLPQDLLQHYGLGCHANATAIEHAGLTRERFGEEERDTTALVVFPLRDGEAGLVAMCDSCALGPALQEQRFINALKANARILRVDQVEQEPVYDLDFFCPESPNAFLFHGDAYLVTDVDPFARVPPERITCSRNGMKHVLSRDVSFDKRDIRGYRDEHGKPWFVISREDGRKAIYSDYCLLTEEIKTGDFASAQPGLASVQSLQGMYQNAENPEEHPTYFFTEKNGHLYMRESNDKDSYPCLYIPDDVAGKGAWVVSNPDGRKIKFRFPEDPESAFLEITDILMGVPQFPPKSIRIRRV